MIPKPQNTFTCPECGTTEVYKVVHHFDYFLAGEYFDSYIDYILVHFGKYDTPEPGNYECVEGHQFVNNSFPE